jgi:hypothetical protein
MAPTTQQNTSQTDISTGKHSKINQTDLPRSKKGAMLWLGPGIPQKRHKESFYQKAKRQNRQLEGETSSSFSSPTFRLSKPIPVMPQTSSTNTTASPSPGPSLSSIWSINPSGSGLASSNKNPTLSSLNALDIKDIIKEAINPLICQISELKAEIEQLKLNLQNPRPIQRSIQRPIQESTQGSVQELL